MSRQEDCKRREPDHGEVAVLVGGDDVEATRLTPSRPVKRKRRASPPFTSPSAAHTVLSLEGSLSEEVLLRCLSFLDVDDLLIVSRVSHAWNRLAADSQLWRQLYLTTFASTRPTPSSKLSPKPRTRPWRDLYKISSNWRKGAARPVTLKEKVRESVLKDVVRPINMEVEEAEERREGVRRRVLPARLEARNTTDTILQFHQKYFFTVSRKPVREGEIPIVEVNKSSIEGGDEPVGVIVSDSIQRFWMRRNGENVNLAATELQLDSTALPDGNLRIAVFYSTGQFSIFHLQLPSSLPSAATEPSQSTTPFVATELYTSLSLALSYPGLPTYDPTLLAQFHSPLLVTCTESFTMHFYRIEYDAKEGGAGKLTINESEPTIKSKESWWPVVLTIAPVLDGTTHYDYDRRRDPTTSGDEFKVTLAYSTPIFPSNWSVGIQEFTVLFPLFPSSLTTAYPISRRMRITQRHAVAQPDRYTFTSRQRRRPESLVTSIEHSGRYIVTSRSDNTIDVFEIVSSSSDYATTSATLTRNPLSSTLLNILHIRTLFGHTSSVSSVAVDDGRCVSGGVDGKVKVWELDSNGADAVSITEEGVGATHEATEVLGWQKLWEGAGKQGEQEGRRIKRVWFDEEKIVSIVGGMENRAGYDGENTDERVRVLHFG